MNDLIELEGVTKTYRRGPEEIHAIDGVDLGIASGEFVAVVGPSGSGKTTLLNLIGCIDLPSEGSVVVAGIEAASLRDAELARVRASTFGFVFQQFFLIPTLSAIENIMLPGRFAVVKKHDLEKRAQELLQLVGMSDRAGHLPGELSGGEMQRVAIARALINGPSVLLADEPTGNLDSRNAEEVMALFEQLNGEGLTIVVVTHNDGLAEKSTRMLHLKDGTVVDDVRVAPVAPVREISTEQVPETAAFEAEEPVVAPVPSGYVPSESKPTYVREYVSAGLTVIAGALAVISAFLSWMAVLSGYSFITLVTLPGGAFGGNAVVRTYSGRGAPLLTGIWAIVIGAAIVASGVAIALRWKRGFLAATIAGTAGFLVAAFNIVVIFVRLDAASVTGVPPGAGLWLLGAASAVAAVVGIAGMRHARHSKRENEPEEAEAPEPAAA